MEIYRKALQFIEERRRFALGIVIEAQYSTPQKPGSKALLDTQGNQWGTLGGGRVESVGLQSMKRALDDGKAELFEFRFDAQYSRDASSICGGVMRIFAAANIEPNAPAYRAAISASEKNQPGLLLTTIEGAPAAIGRATWVNESEISESNGFPDAKDLARCLKEESPEYLTADDGTGIFIEPILSPPQLLIVGGGHIAQALARNAVHLGFQTTILEDRPEFARPELFPPEVQTRCGDVPQSLASLPLNENTYIVLASRGHGTDADALEACIQSDARYIGMIGSKRKVRLIRKNFIETGLATEEEFDRIDTPIGVSIGCVTVPEIAISISAQLVAARRLGTTTRTPAAPTP